MLVAGEFLQRWTEHPTGTAPIGIEVHHHRDVRVGDDLRVTTFHDCDTRIGGPKVYSGRKAVLVFYRGFW